MRVLAVFAHPDDAELACGGTLARHADEGAEVTCLFLSTGVGARSYTRDELQVGAHYKEMDKRMDASDAAARILGCRRITDRFQDQRFDSRPLIDLAQLVEQVSGGVFPDVVYTHWIHDLNLDHELTARAVMTAFRPLPGRKPVQIRMGEVNSSSEWGFTRAFKPNFYIDIEKTLVRKLDALSCYGDEIGEFPHPRSLKAVKARAQVRGSECGLEAAEAFELVRSVE